MEDQNPNNNQNQNNNQQQNEKQIAQIYNELGQLEYQKLQDLQSQEIKEFVDQESPLISDIFDLKDLEKQFDPQSIFYKKIQLLKQKFPNFRKVRRDGSCFYRAYLFQIFERIVQQKDQELYKKIRAIIVKSNEDLKNIGFEEFVLVDFYELMLEKLDQAAKDDADEDILNSIFGDKQVSDYLVMQLRFMTSGYVKMNAVLYECYIEGLTIDQFCQFEIEPIDKEADQIQMMALINYLEVPINIVYLDQSLIQNDIQIMTFPEGSTSENVFVNLLYRPGHYDILYRG